MAIVLIDANNFYASCEQAINPILIRKPVVVLSNNDGCVIARSSEARKLGIKMGTPYFKIKNKLEYLEVKVRSSNYELYGDISRRLMNILQQYCQEFEIYSIDEAFASINRPANKDLHLWAQNLRAVVHQHLGITISIGIGETKVLAKIANYLAKNLDRSAGIFDIGLIRNKDIYLETFEVKNIWGIGKKLTILLNSKGIKNARQLRDMDITILKTNLGIKGIKLQNELKGIQCIEINKIKRSQKELCISRSFPKNINSFEELRQALSIYITIAAEKLRKRSLTTETLTIFTQSSRFKSNFYYKKASIKLKYSTNNTKTLLNETYKIMNNIYQPGKSLTKAGVIMSKLDDYKYKQINLFYNENNKESNKDDRLMYFIDRINKKYRCVALQLGTYNKLKGLNMKRNNLGETNTTSISKIPIVWAK